MTDLNPLDSYEIFNIELMNPNPTSSKTKDGPVYRVSFELADREAWAQFMDANTKGMVINCAMQVQPPEGYIEPKPEPAKKTKGPYGMFARWMIQSGVLRTPAVWKTLGSEAQHKKWVQARPCAVCGDQDRHPETNEPCSEESHVRTSDNAGTSFKPPYISIPMCHSCHTNQHNNGYMALIPTWNAIRKEKHQIKTDTTPTQAADDMLQALKIEAIEYCEDWSKQMLYLYFNIDSLSKLDPQWFNQYIDDAHLSIIIPQKYLSEQGVSNG